MPPTASPAISTAAPSSDRRQFLLTAILGLIFLLGVLCYATLYFGHISGEEFAVNGFKRREFSYYQIPLVGLQITPIHRRDSTNSLESYLVANKVISAPPGNERWDLVVARSGFSTDSTRLVSQGEARILCEYLDAANSKSDSIWLAWTEKNLPLAKVLWPAVAKLARQELYVFVPDLFILARTATDPAVLQHDIDRALAARFVAFGFTHQQLNNHAVAVELFSEALVHQPDNTEAQDARERSLAVLGSATTAEKVEQKPAKK